MTTTRVLVTGANGFVGRALTNRLMNSPYCMVTAAVRSTPPARPDGVVFKQVGELSSTTDWRGALDGVDTVYHLAARVHVMRDDAADPLAEFRRSNVEGTLALARQAASDGVRRFVFVSSIKVNGEQTMSGRPFSAADLPAPKDPYGVSKLEAELGLQRICAETGMQLAIVRPCLVYGPGVRANFLRMMSWVRRGVPLPFGAIDNRRSLVALDNLSHLLVTCGTHPAAAGQTFLAADGEDLSTPALLIGLAKAMRRDARLIHVPPWLMTFAFVGLGQRDLAQRLCGSLQVDISAAQRILGWQPPVSVTDALNQTAHHYLRSLHVER